MDTHRARQPLQIGSSAYEIVPLSSVDELGVDRSALPYAIRILLENLLRNEDGVAVTREHVELLARWTPGTPPPREFSFHPARVLLQDFTGVPAVVDLAAMRQAMAELGGDPRRIDPLQPVELVVDHSIQVDAWATTQAFHTNSELDYQRNHERYTFLKWGQSAFQKLTIVPPNTGICHQVNLEHLARVVMTSAETGGQAPLLAYPDTVVGTDSHTPMVNGVGVLGWGVGGIEAEAAMLGQPMTMLVPEVVGFKLVGRLREGATATDLVLTITEILRKKGVVGKFVEFHGQGLSALPVPDRATIANMSPEFGATCSLFPVDAVTLDYLRFTGRDAERVALVEAYCRAQGLFRADDAPDPKYTDTVVLDLGSVGPSVAGPRRPQDRVVLKDVGRGFQAALPSLVAGESAGEACVTIDGRSFDLKHGSIAIAAITSCTNTSNPSVMIAAGLVAKKAVERGLHPKPWVKTSLAPGSKVVTAYLEKAGLLSYLDRIGFHLVGYGCTTCIGNSGPLLPPVSKAIADGQLVVASVLSGNRNFEGRIHSEVRANYLMSPPLVVAFALVGHIDVDLETDPLGVGKDGKPVFLRDVWPSADEVRSAIDAAISSEMFQASYGRMLEGDDRWLDLSAPTGDRYQWSPTSTYVRLPPYFEGMKADPDRHIGDVTGARCLAVLGDSVTTDHISPAGSIKTDSPAGKYLVAQGVDPKDFNSYGARRGNHEVMVRGTFANGRLKNALVGREGPYTLHVPTGDVLPIYDAAVRYQSDGTPLVVVAGKEYGSGSSRDWAAKGPYLLGVRAVVAQSFERIHRSNLVGMAIVPVQLLEGQDAKSLGITGRETFDVVGVEAALASPDRRATLRWTSEDGSVHEAPVIVRIDTPQEAEYVRHGGILQYVLRSLRKGGPAPTGGPSGGPQVTPSHVPTDRDVERGSRQSFPASDPPTY